jgi:hypothetical protein
MTKAKAKAGRMGRLLAVAALVLVGSLVLVGCGDKGGDDEGGGDVSVTYTGTAGGQVVKVTITSATAASALYTAKNGDAYVITIGGNTESEGTVTVTGAELDFTSSTTPPKTFRLTVSGSGVTGTIVKEEGTEVTVELSAMEGDDDGGEGEEQLPALVPNAIYFKVVDVPAVTGMAELPGYIFYIHTDGATITIANKFNKAAYTSADTGFAALNTLLGLLSVSDAFSTGPGSAIETVTFNMEPTVAKLNSALGNSLVTEGVGLGLLYSMPLGGVTVPAGKKLIILAKTATLGTTDTLTIGTGAEVTAWTIAVKPGAAVAGAGTLTVEPLTAAEFSSFAPLLTGKTSTVNANVVVTLHPAMGSHALISAPITITAGGTGKITIKDTKNPVYIKSVNTAGILIDRNNVELNGLKFNIADLAGLRTDGVAHYALQVGVGRTGVIIDGIDLTITDGITTTDPVTGIGTSTNAGTATATVIKNTTVRNSASTTDTSGGGATGIWVQDFSKVTLDTVIVNTNGSSIAGTNDTAISGNLGSSGAVNLSALTLITGTGRPWIDIGNAPDATYLGSAASGSGSYGTGIANLTTGNRFVTAGVTLVNALRTATANPSTSTIYRLWNGAIGGAGVTKTKVKRAMATTWDIIEYKE